METGTNTLTSCVYSQRSARCNVTVNSAICCAALRVTVQRFLLFLPAKPAPEREIRPYLFQIFCQLAEVRYRRNAVFILQNAVFPCSCPGTCR